MHDLPFCHAAPNVLTSFTTYSLHHDAHFLVVFIAQAMFSMIRARQALLPFPPPATVTYSIHYSMLIVDDITCLMLLKNQPLKLHLLGRLGPLLALLVGYPSYL